MSKIYEELKSIKEDNLKKTPSDKLTKANEKYKELIRTGKVMERGNHLLTLNEQLSNIKMRFSI